MVLRYRVWDSREKKMLYPEHLIDSLEFYALGAHGKMVAIDIDSIRNKNGKTEVVGWNVDHFLTPSLCIGAIDKMGADIYEGDILHGSTNKYLVVFAQSCFSLIRISGDYTPFIKNGVVDLRGCHPQFLAIADQGPKFTIIGNRFENPELLGGTDESSD